MADKQTEKLEREYIIPIKDKWRNVPRYKRANKAIKTIKEFLVRHMKIRDRDLRKIKVDRYLNEFVWFRGIKKPPIKVKVKAIKENEIVKAELAEIPEKLKFKKLREERIGKKAEEIAKEKKIELEKAKEESEKIGVEKTEEKKEEEEKKAAVVESGKEMEKEAARRAKHKTILTKGPKHQFRQALQK